MPTYEYRREDGTTFEVQQKITEDSLETCPETGQKVTRLISGGTGLIFKGSGFYLTDYARAGQNGNADEKKSDSNGKPSDDKSTAKDSASNGKAGSKSTKPESTSAE